MKWEEECESKAESEKKTFKKKNEMHEETSERLKFPISLLRRV